MKKIEKDYIKEYGNVPRDKIDRLDKLLSDLNIGKHRDKIFTTIQKINSIEWKEINFIIYLVPSATPRPRHNCKTNIFYVKGAKDNKDIFYDFISKHDISMIYTPCIFNCTSYVPIPSSMNKLEILLSELGYIRPISKPDWDNVGKTYSDMIQDTLLYDDSLIVDGRSRKFYSTKPRIEISIKYMSEFDSRYNEKKIMKKVR